MRFVPNNLSTVELGVAKYHVCLLGQITHYLTEHKTVISTTIYKSAIPGGMLVLEVRRMETARVRDNVSSFLSLLLWGNSESFRHGNLREYRQWLLDSGFVKVQQLSNGLLSAVR